MFRFFNRELSEDEKKWQTLIAMQTTFEFYPTQKTIFADTYQRIQELKQLSIDELNQLTKNSGTSNLAKSVLDYSIFSAAVVLTPPGP